MNVNLISDTVTKPSEGMLEAMFSAQVGDDVFKEDSSVNTLENEIAALFGMEAALFLITQIPTAHAVVENHFLYNKKN